MWLINCRTLTLEEHLDFKNTKYAILSHTWESGEEVQFDEFRSRTARGKKGWQKIEKTCQLAIEDGFDLAWVDTCCIDKKSSAELSEAINSMFPWYQWSGVCYVYLADFEVSCPRADLSCSRWFTRGWTLQELIAPTRVLFFDSMWKFIGRKNGLGKESSLITELSLITGIEQGVLECSHDHLESALEEVPVARKMSWASERRTTRIEDMAYSLLGIFGINLPLLYGEGETAFLRLQEEIMKHSNDLSLLAWTESDLEGRDSLYSSCSVLARHVRYFGNSRTLALRKDSKQMPDFSTTNKGLRVETELAYRGSEDEWALDINCIDLVRTSQPLSIALRHQGHGIFARTRSSDFADADVSSFKQTGVIFLSKGKERGSPVRYAIRKHFDSCSVPGLEHDLMLWDRSEIHPSKLWQYAEEKFEVNGLCDFVGCHIYRPRKAPTGNSRNHAQPFHVLLGFGYGFPPWVRVMHLEQEHSISREVNRREWKRVAQLANLEANHPVRVASIDDASVLPIDTPPRPVAIMLRATVHELGYDGHVLCVSFQAEFWRVH